MSEQEKGGEKKQEQEQPQLDENRPNFTIGYAKKSGSEDEEESDRIVAKSNNGAIESFEVAIMMLHATANNVLGLLNQLRMREEMMKEQMKKASEKSEQEQSDDKKSEEGEKDGN